MSRGATAVVAVAFAASALSVALAGRPSPTLSDPATRSRAVAVSAATLSCPGSPTNRQTGSVFAAAPGMSTEAGSRETGDVKVVRLSPDKQTPIGRLRSRGSTTLPLPPDRMPLSIMGTGGLAAGMTGAEWSHPRAGASGLAATWCQAPAVDWWFNGVRSAVGSTSRLFLSNPTAGVVVVDLAFYGGTGAAGVAGPRGIALAPQSSRSFDISRFAPGLEAGTIRVHAAQGRIVAAVHSSRTVGLRTRGAEWIPAAETPSGDVVVNAALSGAAHCCTVSVTNPGRREALVQLTVLDADGEFAPVGLTNMRIAPETVRTVDLGKVTNGSSAAVHLSSTVPVTASTETDARGVGGDFAVVSTSRGLDDPAVVPVIDGSRLSLSFTNAERATAVVTIAAVDGHGSAVSKQDVNVEGRKVTSWRLRRGSGAAYVVVSVRLGQTLHAVADYVGRAGVSALPVLSGTYTVTRPSVTPVL